MARSHVSTTAFDGTRQRHEGARAAAAIFMGDRGVQNHAQQVRTFKAALRKELAAVQQVAAKENEGRGPPDWARDCGVTRDVVSKYFQRVQQRSSHAETKLEMMVELLQGLTSFRQRTSCNAEELAKQLDKYARGIVILLEQRDVLSDDVDHALKRCSRNFDDCARCFSAFDGFPMFERLNLKAGDAAAKARAVIRGDSEWEDEDEDYWQSSSDDAMPPPKKPRA